MRVPHPAEDEGVELPPGEYRPDGDVTPVPAGLRIQCRHVSNSGSNSVTPIDVATNQPGTTISVGGLPTGIAITPAPRITPTSTRLNANPARSPWGIIVFDVLDADGEGAISLEEYRAFRDVYGVDNANAAEHFARLDANNDSAISREGFGALMADFFLSDDPEAPGSVLFGDF